MLIAYRIRRFAGNTFLAIGVLGTSAATLPGATHPAGAGAVFDAVQTLSGSNAGSGVGVL